MPEDLVEEGHVRIPRRKVLHRRQDGTEPLHDELAHSILLGQEGVQVLLQGLAGLLLLSLSAGAGRQLLRVTGVPVTVKGLLPAAQKEGSGGKQVDPFST